VILLLSLIGCVNAVVVGNGSVPIRIGMTYFFDPHWGLNNLALKNQIYYVVHLAEKLAGEYSDTEFSMEFYDAYGEGSAYESMQLNFYDQDGKPHLWLGGGFDTPVLMCSLVTSIYSIPFIHHNGKTTWEDRSLYKYSFASRQSVSSIAIAALPLLQYFNMSGYSSLYYDSAVDKEAFQYELLVDSVDVQVTGTRLSYPQEETTMNLVCSGDMIAPIRVKKIGQISCPHLWKLTASQWTSTSTPVELFSCGSTLLLQQPVDTSCLTSDFSTRSITSYTKAGV